jgi:small GTP-binding protein
MSNVLKMIEEAAKTEQTELDLSYDELSELSSEITKLADFETLNWHSNVLTELPPEITKLKNLTTLNLSGNQLTELPPEITKLKNLTTLNLSGNQLTELPPEITNLTNLTTLNLSGNQLTELPLKITKLKNLTTLNLNYNQLTELPLEITKLKNLTTLNLSGNQLPELPIEITKLTNLTALDLSSNQLIELPIEITKLMNLIALNLSFNELTELPLEITKQMNLTALNLSFNELTELPIEITNLTNLTSLDLNYNELTELPFNIAKLTNLTSLDLNYNQLTELPFDITNLTNLTSLGLSGNQLTELPFDITNLTNLTSLGLSGNQLTELPFNITKLKNLISLDLSEIGLKELPIEITNLTNLTSLELSDNELKELPFEIMNLTNLTSLSLERNQLMEFPHEITNLINLKMLLIHMNQLKELPPEITNLTKLEYLDLSENPLKLPPIEIAEKGIEAIRDYFKSLEESERQPLNEVKVLLVGDGGAGKTSLVKRLLEDEFNNNEPKTHGININKWEISDGEDKIKVHFWDFGGQEIMHATHQFFLSKRSLYVLVLDGRKEEEEEYWLKHIESFGGDSPILVVINKIDDNPSFDVNRPFLQAKYKGIKGFHRISCKENEGIDSFDETLRNELAKVELRKEPFAKNWFNVKTKLENMTDNFISYEEYQKLCIEENITNESAQETLIGFLSHLGIILYFKEFHLDHTHVLEPKWITGAVYKIINSKKVAENNGLLRLNSLYDILKQRDETDYFYPREKHEYIIDLMKKFELCYEIESGCILIPDLLEIPEPEFDFDYSSSLKFLIDYDFLPKSVMPRFIVKMHKDIKDNLRWRTGVVLENVTFNSTAVIKADENDKKIYIFVGGKQKRDYFSAILHKLREINNDFGNIATERVPLPDEPEITVSYEHLIRLDGKGVKMYFPDGSENEYNVKELLGTVFVENKNEEEILRLLKKLVDKNDTEESLKEKANNIIMLQPNVFGMGLNVNELVRKAIKRDK